VATSGCGEFLLIVSQAMLKLIQDVADDGDEAYAQLAIGFCKAIQVRRDCIGMALS
jgi:hypothetical protein